MKVDSHSPSGGAVLGEQQECYACRPPQELSTISLEQQVIHQFPHQDIPVCGQDPPAPRTCPPKYKGCLTQYHGELVVQLCGELKINACQTANKVEYCYCEGQLCNKHAPRKAPNLETGVSSDDTEDDDEEEGSGGRRQFPFVPTMVTAPSTASTPGYSSLVPFVAVLTTTLIFLF